MNRATAATIGLGLLAALQLLLAFPLGFLALLSLDKLFAPRNTSHMTLEVLLILGTVAGLLSPLALAFPRRALWLVISGMIMAASFAGLSSPLYRGFIH